LDPATLAKDTWMGGFYMEVHVDGWIADKTVTIDFKTADIGLGPHACQNVRVVGFTDTTITFVLIQQPWICCESFGCAIRGERPAALSFSCGVLASPPPSPPPSPGLPPPPSPPQPRPPPPPAPPPPPMLYRPPTPPPPPIHLVDKDGLVTTNGAALTDTRNEGVGGLPQGGPSNSGPGGVGPPAGPAAAMAAEPTTVIVIGVIVVLLAALYHARSLGLLRVLQRLILERRGVHAVPIMAVTEARAAGFKPRARPKAVTVRIVKGG